jgi:carbon storage regulator
MLILTRRPGERVVIGDEILVTVMGVSGHTVRLGIAAPEGVPIYREEIWLAVKEENRAAAAAAGDVDVEALPGAQAPEGEEPAAKSPPSEPPGSGS